MVPEIGVILGVIVTLLMVVVVDARVLDGVRMRMVARFEDEFVDASVIGEAVTGG